MMWARSSGSRYVYRAGREAAEIVVALSTQGITVSVSPPTTTPIDSMKRGLDALVHAFYHSVEVSSRTE